MAATIPTTIAGDHGFDLGELRTSLGLSPLARWSELNLGNVTELFGEDRLAPRWHDSFVLVASSYIEAWERLPLLRSMGKAHQVFVLIKGAPRPFPAAGPPTTPQLATGLASNNSAGHEGYTMLAVPGAPWVDVHRAVAAVLTHQTPGRVGAILQGLRVGTTDPALAPWLSGDTLASLLTENSLNVDPSDIFPVDVLVSRSVVADKSSRGPRAILEIRESSGSDGWDAMLPPVNTRFVSPRGFEPYPKSGRVKLRWSELDRLDFVDPKGDSLVLSSRPDVALDESVVNAIRDRSYLDLSGVKAETDPLQLSRLVSSVAVAGIPMLIPQPLRDRLILGNDLVDGIARFSEQDSFTVREFKSILMRRTALKYFEPSQRWAHWSKDSGLAPATRSVSVVLATKRPGRVSEAVHQINAQSWPELEIVLVLHGFDLSETALQNLRCATKRTIKVVTAEQSLVLGEALNLGVQASNGDFIAKMDDDDWYGSHHIEDLMQARLYSGAELLGSQVEFVYLEDLDITTRRPPEGERYADHVAGGTMLISRSMLTEVGGWRPVHRAVDRCLLNAVEAAGGLTYRGHGQNYMMHRHAQQGSHGGHTWAPETEIFVQNSIQQWDGFAPTPSIESCWKGLNPERAQNFRSIFTRKDSTT